MCYKSKFLEFVSSATPPSIIVTKQKTSCLVVERILPRKMNPDGS